MTRRDLIGLAPAVLLGAQAKKLNVGLIGCGWYGGVVLDAMYKAGGIETVALCDVDSEHLTKTADKYEKVQGSRPRLHNDYRELLASKGLDAVVIASPPHWHALHFIEACRSGLNVYCEKPLSYDIREGQAMVAAWKKAGNIVQIGFQRRHAAGFGAAREFLRSGGAGRIINIDAHIHYNANPKPYKPQDPPASLDWDAWCGPAPKLAYSENIGHMAWRLEKEYGNGHLVDWGIHLIDSIRYMTGFGTPAAVTASGGLYEYKGRITTPDTMTAYFEFEQAPVVWRHRLWGAAEPDLPNGVYIFGDKGTVFAEDGKATFLARASKGPAQELPVQPGDAQVRHVGNFLDAVRARKQPACTPDDAWQSTTTVHLGMLSYYSGAKLNWNAQSAQIGGNAAAAKLMKREYRAPYKHPFA